MRIRDRRNDRKAQPGSGCVARAAAEPLERARDEARGKALSLVDDVQLERAGTLRRFEPHRPGSVAQGVLDKVSERLLEPPPVRKHLDARGNNDLDLTLRVIRAPSKPCRNRVEQVFNRNARPAQRQRSGIDTRQQKQIVGELREPVGLLGG